MGNIAVINAAALTSQAREPVFGGPCALERAVAWGSAIPECEGVVFLTADEDPNLPASPRELRIVYRDTWNEAELITALGDAARAFGDRGIDTMFYAWGDCPLLDDKTTAELWALHYRYDAEYTFADGYPQGVSPELLSTRLPERLIPMAAGRRSPPARNSIFEVLRQDINAFDVETHLAPADMRMDRVSITCDTRRNRNIAERLYAAGGRDADSLCAVIPDNRGLLRDLPAYFPVQITNRSPQMCSYGPFPEFGGDPRLGETHMPAERFAELCRGIANFAGDAVIVPSLRGEPSCHPEIGTIIRSALNAGDPGSVRVLIETSGIGWNHGLLGELAGEVQSGRLMWIVLLDAADPELYRRLRGEGMEEAESTARILAELFGDYCWMQAVRMNENEEDLENFYARWKDVGAGPIIQKYDSYAGYLPNRQPADLSPLERFPCWHLKRDMPILIDGTVPLCCSDPGRHDALGNVFSESLAEVWERGEPVHRAHVEGVYPSPCAECDEYYTFNF